MNKTKIGIFLSLLLLVGLTSCGEQKSNNKLMLNEILIDNQNNFQDDYGLHSAWIEIFNRSYGSADLAGCLLKVSSQPGDTVTYFIPKGDVLTLVKPRQHALFWADGEPNRGTFHTSCKLNPETANWIGLFDSGRNIIDQIVVPANALGADQSYARISDGAADWEVKGGSKDKYVTPSTNNKTLDSNAKMEKFEEHDSVGIGMSISAMSVVFCGLILLFVAFKVVGKVAVNLSKRNAMKAKGLFDSGRNIIDQIVVPANALGADQSYARISDGAADWEVKGGSKDKYVTPSTNNKTLDSNAKMEKFEEHDSVGIGMSISAMSVVFCGLILLFVAFKVVGKVAVNLSKRNAMKAKGIDKVEAKELSQAPGEVYAAISMALHEMQDEVHDVEETVLTITRVKRSYSPWSSKIYTLRENPNRK